MGNRQRKEENIYIKPAPLTAGDTTLLRQIAIDSYLDHFQFLWFDKGAWYINKVYNEETLRNELLEMNNQFFIAYRDEEPVGFLKIKLDRPSPGGIGKNALELEKIYVRASVCGKGVGKKFMELAIQKATELQKDIIWLRAMDISVDSIKFYQQNGFVPCGNDKLDFEILKPEFRGMVVMQRAVADGSFVDSEQLTVES